MSYIELVRDVFHDKTICPSLEESIFIKELPKVLNEMQKTKHCKADILFRRYGLHNYEKQTLNQISEAYGISREGIRQLEQKALRILKYPLRKFCFITGTPMLLNINMRTEIKELNVKIIQLTERREHLIKVLKNPIENSIETLELSVTASSPLKRANITKINNLIKLTEVDLLRLPGLGRKSLNDIKERLLTFGLFLNKRRN